MMADTSKYISRIVFSKVLRDYFTNLKVIRADLFIHEKIVCEWDVNLMALRKSKKFLQKTLLNMQGALFYKIALRSATLPLQTMATSIKKPLIAERLLVGPLGIEPSTY